MNFTYIQDTAISRCLWKSALPDVVPANTWKKGALSRRIRRLMFDHRCISLFSLLVTFWTQSCLFGTTFATAFSFILATHEAGHLIAGRYFNISLYWPIFIPKVGALVVLKKEIPTVYEDAWLGISGPIGGFSATVLINLLAVYTNSSDLKFCATAGYAMHLFNLIPIGELDGGRVASLIGNWLWIFGAALLIGFLYHFQALPWYTRLGILWVLWSGLQKMRDLTSRPGHNLGSPQKVDAKTKLGFAALYLSLILLCVLGIRSKL
jgi:membrane-associated protease RseP (regulator of RpoE activity)